MIPMSTLIQALEALGAAQEDMRLRGDFEAYMQVANARSALKLALGDLPPVAVRPEQPVLNPTFSVAPLQSTIPEFIAGAV